MPISPPSAIQSEIVIEDVFKDATIPKIYSNSFAFGHNLTDVTIVFQLMQSPLTAIIIDFTSAKTLYNSLGNIIQVIEKGLGYELKDYAGTMIEWLKNANPPQAQLPAENNQPTITE